MVARVAAVVACLVSRVLEQAGRVTLVALVRRRDVGRMRWLLRAIIVAAPMGFIATEAGWMVTEVGRQPAPPLRGGTLSLLRMRATSFSDFPEM
jgi:cytochrome bd-type quinol oxidase subunit 1